MIERIKNIYIETIALIDYGSIKIIQFRNIYIKSEALDLQMNEFRVKKYFFLTRSLVISENE